VTDSLRLDKFLVQARFFKTRALAAKLIAGGRVRLDGTPVAVGTEVIIDRVEGGVAYVESWVEVEQRL